MNTYQIGKTPKGEVIDMAQVSWVMVHGSANYNEAVKMLENGASIADVQRQFCACCGEPYSEEHTCSNPHPQA